MLESIHDQTSLRYTTKKFDDHYCKKYLRVRCNAFISETGTWKTVRDHLLLDFHNGEFTFYFYRYFLINNHAFFLLSSQIMFKKLFFVKSDTEDMVHYYIQRTANNN